MPLSSQRWTQVMVMFLLLLAANVFVARSALAQGPGTTFSYQGSLRNGDTLVNDTCAFEFKLYDAIAAGVQLGASQTVNNVTVSNGAFMVELDFGPQAFTGPPRYLEIGVRCGDDSSLTTLSPRQVLYPTPYAMYAAQAGSVTWSDVISKPANLAVITDTISGLSCSDGQVAKWNAAAGQWLCATDVGGASYSAGTGIAIAGGVISSTLSAGPGLVLSGETFAISDTYRLPQTCANLQIPKWTGSGWVCADDSNTDTTYSAGLGLTLSGQTFTLSDTYRLPQTCANGQLPQWDLTTQSWDCTTAASYSAGTGLQLLGNQFSLSTTYRLPQICAIGKITQWDGSDWICADDLDTDTLAGLTCADNEIAKWNGAAWACAADLDTDTDTTYTAGTGIEIADDIISSTLTAGTGLSLGGDQLSITPTYRLPQMCSNGQVAKWNGTAWACAVDLDADTTYTAGAGIEITNDTISSTLTAGTGLNLSGDQLSITPTYRLPQTCSDGQVAKWNGTAWLCATDANTDTTYTAGAGIEIVDDVISSTLIAGAGITVANDIISSTVPQPANIVWVAKSGGDFTSIQAALDSITDAAANNPYLVLVAPGVYTEKVTMTPYVDIEGAGQDQTIISWTGGNALDGNSATVIGANNAGLRFLTVQNTCGADYFVAIALYNDNAAPTLNTVTTAAVGDKFNVSVYNDNAAAPMLNNVTATAAGGSQNYGLFNSNGAPVIRDSTLTGATSSFVGGNAIIATSMLDGPIAYGNTCTDVRNGDGDMLDSDCQLGTNGQSLVAAADGTVNWQDPITYTAGTGITITNDIINSTVAQPANILWVAKSGGDFTSIQAALNSITAAADNPYLIKVAPGVYTEQVTMKSYVDIEGSGQGKTIIRWMGGSTSPSTGNGSATVIGADNAELRFLSVESDGTGKNYAVGIFTDNASPSLMNLTFIASRSNNNYGVFSANNSSPMLNNVTILVGGGILAIGVNNRSSSSLKMTGVTILAGLASGISTSYPYGVYNTSASLTMNNVTIIASGGHDSTGTHNDTSASLVMDNVTMTVSGSGYNYGVRNLSSASLTMTNVTATVTDGETNYGVYNNAASLLITGGTLTAVGGTFSHGVYNSASTATINNTTASASEGNTNDGIYNSNATVTINNTTATASGGTGSRGIYNSASTVTINNTTTTASEGNTNTGIHNNSSSLTMNNVTVTTVGGTSSYGVYNLSSSPTIRNSALIGSGLSIYGSGAKVATSMLDGPVDSGNTCFQTYDANFAPVTCPP